MAKPKKPGLVAVPSKARREFSQKRAKTGFRRSPAAGWIAAVVFTAAGWLIS